MISTRSSSNLKSENSTKRNRKKGASKEQHQQERHKKQTEKQELHFQVEGALTTFNTTASFSEMTATHRSYPDNDSSSHCPNPARAEKGFYNFWADARAAIQEQQQQLQQHHQRLNFSAVESAYVEVGTQSNTALSNDMTATHQPCPDNISSSHTSSPARANEDSSSTIKDSKRAYSKGRSTNNRTQDEQTLRRGSSRNRASTSTAQQQMHETADPKKRKNNFNFSRSTFLSQARAVKQEQQQQEEEAACVNNISTTAQDISQHINGAGAPATSVVVPKKEDSPSASPQHTPGVSTAAPTASMVMPKRAESPPASAQRAAAVSTVDRGFGRQSHEHDHVSDIWDKPVYDSSEESTEESSEEVSYGASEKVNYETSNGSNDELTGRRTSDSSFEATKSDIDERNEALSKQKKNIRTRYSSHEKVKVLQYFKDTGATGPELSLRFGVPLRTVRRWVQHADLILHDYVLNLNEKSIYNSSEEASKGGCYRESEKERDEARNKSSDERKRFKRIRYSFDEKVKVLQYLKDTGATVSEVSSRFGIHYHTVLYWVKYADSIYEAGRYSVVDSSAVDAGESNSYGRRKKFAHQRKCFSLDKKVEVLQYLEDTGATIPEASLRFGITEKNIKYWVQNADAIHGGLTNKKGGRKTSRTRMRLIERALWDFVKENRKLDSSKKIFLRSFIIQEKALAVKDKLLKEHGQSPFLDDKELSELNNFGATDRWAFDWMKRNLDRQKRGHYY